ncbi:MAG: hypothetical protein ACKVZ0_06490 [Gemmatimonadales bacterium]
MILVVLIAIGFGSAVAALAAAAGDGGVRQTREAFLAMAAEGAARAGVVGALSGSWLDSTAGAVPGYQVVVGVASPRPATSVRLRAEWLRGDLWLLDGFAEIRDAAGRPRARARAGIIVHVYVNPVDSTRYAVPIRRPWVAGFQ